MGIDNFETVWPEWKITELIGEGAYGKVYKAVREDHGISSYSAIKVISIPQNDAETESLRLEGLDETATKTYFEEIVTEFLSEIKVMESLKETSNVVSIEDSIVIEKSDKIGWDIYIRMELLTSFNDYASDKKLTENEIIKLGIDICGALELCAQKNIIHRDIKPENIFISDSGNFKLGDFGISRQLEKTMSALSRKGTLNYIAPEVNKGSEYDSRADIYSLGIVLYKLLNNNRIPFVDPYKQLVQYKDRVKAIEKRMIGEPLLPPVNASEELAAVILNACAYNPEDRFENPMLLREMLAKLFDNTIKYNYNLKASDRQVKKTVVVDDAIISSEKEDNSALSQKKSLKNPFKITGIAAWCVVMLALIAFIISINADNKISETTTVTSQAFIVVPDLVNILGTEAIGILYEKGFVPTRDYVFDEKVKNGFVIEQSLKTGEKAVKGSKITIKLSMGKEKETVPELIGKSATDASTYLTALGFKIEIVEKIDNNKTPGMVISQSPNKGTVLRIGETVKVTICIGSGKVSVPNVKGSTISVATSILKKVGLSLETIFDYSDSIAKDVVISQNPVTGELSKGSVVELHVSKGTEKEYVPDVRKMTTSEAQAVLLSAGFKEIINYEYNNFIDKDRIISQGIKPGTKMNKGSVIKLTISKGKAPVIKPTVPPTVPSTAPTTTEPSATTTEPNTTTTEPTSTTTETDPTTTKPPISETTIPETTTGGTTES